jgi:hypothetical protein
MLDQFVFHQEKEDVAFVKFENRIVRITFKRHKGTHLNYDTNQKVMEVTLTFSKVGVKWLKVH